MEPSPGWEETDSSVYLFVLTCGGECNVVDEMTKEVAPEFMMDKSVWKLKIPTFKREVEVRGIFCFILNKVRL